jgi:hypothetical protein
MKSFEILFAIFVCSLISLCGNALADQWTPVIATECAMITLEKSTPAPIPQPAPKPDPDGAKPGSQAVTSPLDMFRDARTLIDKGQSLADRSKAILDQAEQDGKITLDVHLPKPAPTELARADVSSGCKNCHGGVCPYAPNASEKNKSDTTATDKTPASSGCQGGTCSKGLLRRFRR